MPFVIYRDQSIAPPIQKAPPKPRFVQDQLEKNQAYSFELKQVYPVSGGEFSFEERNLKRWIQRRKDVALTEEIKRLHAIINELQLQIHQQQENASEPNELGNVSPGSVPNRLSVIPKNPQPTQDVDGCLYGAFDEAPTVVRNLWNRSLCGYVGDKTTAFDKFTVPIDQSTYIRDNATTSTPTGKAKPRTNGNNRRCSRPSVGGGSPTLKLSPITETSRDCNSKSSSSSSGVTATPGTVKKQPLVDRPIINAEPELVLDPFNPATYRSLLRVLAEPLDRRSDYTRLDRNIPKIRPGACFDAGTDKYLVDQQLCDNPNVFTAQLLSDDSTDCAVKLISLRVDQPANEWLYYICSELHRRLVKQKTNPDIELSVMMTDPALIYRDGSILVDEYSRFVTLNDYINACAELNRPFPKSVAAYITLELIQLVHQIHSCGIIHTNINTNNLIITGCPTREDVARVDERTSIIKLIGFENAMDIKLIGETFSPDDETVATHPWIYGSDWTATLNCIHKMFFLEDLTFDKNENGIKSVDKIKFKGFPTSVWGSLFEELLNVGNDFNAATSAVKKSSEELYIWIKANINFVMKEADALDRTLEQHSNE